MQRALSAVERQIDPDGRQQRESQLPKCHQEIDVLFAPCLDERAALVRFG